VLRSIKRTLTEAALRRMEPSPSLIMQKPEPALIEMSEIHKRTGNADTERICMSVGYLLGEHGDC
jgi:hypothetical protein